MGCGKVTFSRGFRLLVLLACVVAFLVLSSISLVKFIQAEMVKSYEVDESAQQKFAVTICKTQPLILQPDVYQAVTGRRYVEARDPMQLLLENFPFGKADLNTSLWSMTYSMDDLAESCSSFYNKPCDAKDIRSGLYHYGGQCHTVQYDDSLAEGVQRGLMLKLRPQQCANCSRAHWVFYVHAAKDLYFDWEHVWAPQRAYLEIGKMQTFKVQRTLDIRLPTDQRPCRDDQEYSRINCIRSCFFDQLARLGPGCRLPWMAGHLPVCSSRDDFRQLFLYSRLVSRSEVVWNFTYEALQQNRRYRALKGIEESCKRRCPKECYIDRVTISMADRSNQDFTFLTLSINEGLYVSKQTLAYDFQQMVSDIGGNLGLLLGASIFTLFELFESAARRCWRRMKSRNAAGNSSIHVRSAELKVAPEAAMFAPEAHISI